MYLLPCNPIVLDILLLFNTFISGSIENQRTWFIATQVNVLLMPLQLNMIPLPLQNTSSIVSSAFTQLKQHVLGNAW
jgi:hypothetical protein